MSAAPAPNLPRPARSAAAVLLAVYFALGFFSMWQQSITYDEAAHWRYGQNVLRGDTSRFDDSKMPASALNGLAPVLKAAWWPDRPMSGMTLLRLSRVPTLLAACLLGWLVFLWAGSLSGARGGLAALTLFLIDPNLAAHAQWITTDIYAALGITLSVYTFWRFLDSPGWARAVIAGIALGAAQLAKFSSVYLYALLPLLALAYIVLRPACERMAKARAASAFSLVILAVSLGALAAGYLANGWGTPLSGYEFKSGLFKAVQEHAGVLASLPLPLPRPFVGGLDWVKFYEQTASGRGPAYLFGQASLEAFPNYYAWVAAFKVPVGILLISAIAAAVWVGSIFSKQRDTLSKADALMPLGVCVFFAVYLNYFCEAQMGIRLGLVLFPALYVFAGAVLGPKLTLSFGKRPAAGALSACIAALAIWSAVSVAAHYPHLLGYFNEFAGKPVHYHRILADSNLEWGQNQIFVRRYAAEHPGLQIDPRVPTVGRIAISANFLVGIVKPTEYAWARWLKENKEPVDHIAYGYLVYDVTREDIGLMLNRPRP